MAERQARCSDRMRDRAQKAEQARHYRRKKENHMLALILGLVILLSSVGVAAVSVPQVPASATDEIVVAATAEEKEDQERLFTQYAVGVRADASYVYGYVKNVFTLFPSTVPVTVSLYRSETYTEDISQMTHVALMFTPDLNMGEEAVARVPQDGNTYYWRAQLTYWDDSGMQQTLESGTVGYDSNGNVVL